jgi:agmatinase
MPAFDPNAAAAQGSGIFGLTSTEEESALVYVPVPWEATTSYGGGTAQGPRAILDASKQVDLFDLDVHNPYEAGLFMLPEAEEVVAWNTRAREEALRVIEVGGDVRGSGELKVALNMVNALSVKLNGWVLDTTRRLLAAKKLVGIVGGDHSVPFGAMQAMAELKKFGVLHFDAHSDTRDAFEGFTFSHASIMHNVLERLPGVTHLVQVGIRDVCEAEVDYTTRQGERVKVFYDRDMAARKIEGAPFAAITKEIVAALPREVWVSFDVDGLDPRLCPHTGTPVPGGLDFHEACYVLREVVRSGRRIVGFDLNEVAPDAHDPTDAWDANVGARLLYKLSALTLASQGKAKLRGQ